MPLVDVPIPDATRSIPHDMRRFLKEADVRVEEALAEAGSPAFVPSDYEMIAPVLLTLADSVLLRGNSFCEWGSGLGVTACLASMIGFESYGIETEWELIDGARRLANDFDLNVEFVHGSFIPVGGEHLAVISGDYAWLSTAETAAYTELGLETDDFDLIFAYPWPDEEQVTFDLFEAFAGEGALLLTYRGGDGLRLRRKMSDRKKLKRSIQRRR